MRGWLAEQFDPLPKASISAVKGSTVVLSPQIADFSIHLPVVAIQSSLNDALLITHPSTNEHALNPKAWITNSFSSVVSFGPSDLAAYRFDLQPAPNFQLDVPLLQAIIHDSISVAIDHIAIFEATLPESISVGANLLSPLTMPSIFGKSYIGTTTTPPQQKSLFPRDDQSRSDDNPILSRKALLGTSFRNRRTRPTLDLFDLLLPILMPPLHLDETSTLDLPNELYPFQIDGIKRLVTNKSFLLADEMGTGKTVMTSVALRMLFQMGKVLRTLIVCPKSLLGVWDVHLRDWASILSVTVVDGSKAMRTIDWNSTSHVYVVSYDALRIDSTREEFSTKSVIELACADITFDAVVLDEAHTVRSSTSKRTKAVKRIAKNAMYRWALTGTPVQNSTDDVRSLFDLIKPKLFRRIDFQLPASEVAKRIEPYFLRRRKSDVFPDLPAKIRSDEWLSLDDSQRCSYEALLLQGQTAFSTKEKPFTRMHVFALLSRLKQICNFAPESANSPKSIATEERIMEIAANNRKTLVFSQYLDAGVRRLEPLLEKYGLISLLAGHNSKQRIELVNRFQDDPNISVLLTTPRIGGEGLTLTAASYVVHFDHWWNPAVAWQAEDRAHRKGQKECVNVYSFWMRDTIEERIRSILERKGLLHEEIVESLSEADFDQALSIDDLLEVLELKRNAVDIPSSEEPNQPVHTSIPEAFSRLSIIDPTRFEHVVKEVFQKSLGFANARVTGRSSDGGVDIQATKVVQGRIERIAVQCKRTEKVGPNVARELLGVVTADPSLTRGYLVTSGRFTSACRQFVDSVSSLTLIDGIRLAKYICDSSITID
jgi:superfamily II DNA or RNA helicase